MNSSVDEMSITTAVGRPKRCDVAGEARALLPIRGAGEKPAASAAKSVNRRKRAIAVAGVEADDAMTSDQQIRSAPAGGARLIR